ncbi:energy-coupling factor transporter transmembrane component T family protein [Candidatus Arthromitus sp. SFB-rat-Yit]|uniref:energy-coupling factor transporter transmembrane component T family protein n=1 Tax=Candidatus Arthromitus sp. SFB-rat-Yit TaxID=1041504 RepID=UPI000227A12B|nr:energy-coupling factor transporter transmembrane component T [Candidatus Arthromitus sp. SFB-rat-Yit]BAK81874.1 putative cobalt ABC transporter, permease protein [Candidatus Arthromitus sp. SFB-rat-Yit]
MKLVLEYIDKNSFIHNLTGATKLICFILWCTITIITYDTRLLISLLILSLFLFKISKIKFKDISLIIIFILIFLLLNNILIYIFGPNTGSEIYGTKTILLNFNNSYSVTAEQIFYQFNITLKYFSVIPISLLFILTTNPSEFAASLNKIGINYKISYSISLALRYIPDIIEDYKNVSLSKQARGIDMSKNEKLIVRMKNMFLIIIPIIFSSLNRIDKISCAMELRGFGYNKKRTWYNQKKFKKNDILSILFFIILNLISIYLFHTNNGRFFNPFK